MNDVELLAEFEDVLRTMPPRATLRQDTVENLAWLGRAAAVIERWNSAAGARAIKHISDIHETLAVDVQRGYLGLMVLLNQARSDLRMQTLGPVNQAIGQGQVFNYFDEIRKIITLAKTDLLFVDPYLDAGFVSAYLPQVGPGVAIRLLAREKLPTLIPAARLFVQQTKANVELRSASNFHDRYILLDGTSCYQSGASFKDGGRTSPTTITQITDAFPAVRQTYEALWNGAKPEPL